MHVAAIWHEVHDGVTDQLARTVIGDVSPPFRFEQSHAALGQRVRRSQHMVTTMTRADPERNHVWVLHQQ